MLLSGIVVITWSATLKEASAEPLGFQRARNSLSVGIGAGNFFAGDFGDQAGLGVGIVIQEVVQRGNWGLGARLSFMVHGADPPDLPFDSGLETYHLAIGPRFIWPVVGDFLLAFQTEYVFLGLSSNSLVQATDGRDILHGAGMMVGAEYLIGRLVLELGAGATYLPEVNSVMTLVSLNVGVAGLF